MTGAPKIPRISIVMAVHNGEAYLREAVESMLHQTVTDFEFIIVDDGSTDRSAEIIGSYGDERIHLTRQDNMGLSRSLNRGLDLARAPYIARMDADDISLPTRLEKQLAFMEVHRDIDVLGTWAETFGDRAPTAWKFPTDPKVIQCEMLFHSVLVHPSVLIRRKAIEQHNLRYDPQVPYAQDFDLWHRAAAELRYANLPEVLIRYRIRETNSDRVERRKKRNAILLEIYTRALNQVGLTPTQDEIELHRALGQFQFEPGLDFLVKTEQWLRKLRDANRVTRHFPASHFEDTIGKVWLAAFRRSRGDLFRALKLFRSSPLSSLSRVSDRASTLLQRVLGSASSVRAGLA